MTLFQTVKKNPKKSDVMKSRKAIITSKGYVVISTVRDN